MVKTRMRKHLLLAGIALCVVAVNHSQAGNLTIKVADKAPPEVVAESKAQLEKLRAQRLALEEARKIAGEL